jgi:mRNA interferase MazF
MPSIMSYKHGDVVLVPFPFTDLSTAKQRPALVVSADWFNEIRHDRVLVALTSQIPDTLEDDQYSLSHADITDAGLPKPSMVKLGKIFTIEQGLIRKTLGALSQPTMKAISQALARVLSMESA